MQRFIQELAIFLSIQAAILAVVVHKDRTGNGDYVSAVIDKHQRLRCAPPPRIIFMGGSSLAFGLDSLRIARELHRNPVNMGVHGGLGLDYIIGQVPPAEIQTGDLVVFNLEYEHFCSDLTHLDVLFPALRARPAALAGLDFHAIKRLFDDAMAIPTIEMRSWIASLSSSNPDASATERWRPYFRTDFNTFGDIVKRDRRLSSRDREDLFTVAPKLLISDWQIQEAITRLNDFGSKCRQRGAAVVFFYPAYCDWLYRQKNQSTIQHIDLEVRKTLRMPILNTPEEALAPITYFYDTFYHLNQEGVDWRTSKLITGLAPQLGRGRLQADAQHP